MLGIQWLRTYLDALEHGWNSFGRGWDSLGRGWRAVFFGLLVVLVFALL
ncbi:hypothetical protein [Halorussus halophilus]|nr:hypothetical protein [Halorussus halophilus]